MNYSGKFTVFGTSYTIFPLRTLPLRGWQFVGYRINDLIRFIRFLAVTVDRIRFIFTDKVIHYSANQGMVDNTLVVFVSDRPRVREAKLATALRKSGKRVVLLYNTAPNYESNSYFDECRRYKNSWQALLLALKYQPLVYHVFTLWYYETAYRFVRYKPGRIVLDTNDTIVGTASTGYINKADWLNELIIQECYALENAAGICCRDLQVQNACRSGGYQRPKQTIFFPEYLWQTKQPSKSRPSGDPDPHVVLIGHFGNKVMGDEKEAGYLDIIRILTGQGIHFHIYPHWFYNNKVYFKDGVRGIFDEYFQLEHDNPHIHIHSSVPMEAVVKEISQYDFGIHILRSVLFGEPYERYTAEAMKICTSARISDYLEAGLPVIGTTETYMYRLLSRYGVMVGLTRDNIHDFKPLLLAMMNENTQSNLSAVQNRYLLAHHSPRLINFYNQIAGLN
ncbi:MAG: hypothetical protein ABIA75_03690 [Candidatus Neomarinimicrobiota bacterium]